MMFLFFFFFQKRVYMVRSGATFANAQEKGKFPHEKIEIF